MKFVFYIINLEEGTVEGSNSVESVDKYVESDEYLVLHQGGVYFLGSRKENEVIELDNSQDSEEEED